MNTISREELKQKIESNEKFLLLMCMNMATYSLKHIPRSICFDINGNVQCDFDPEENIIVYCSSAECRFSTNAYNLLESKGYKRIYHYPGGLEDWENAGYTVEGTV